MFKPLLIACLVSFLIVSACKKPALVIKPVQTETIPLIEIGSEKFATAEFLDSYEKNKSASDSAKSLTPEEYLNLYTNLKIKVLQARQQGKDTASDFKEEMASYRAQLAKNFLVDKSLTEQLAAEAYARLKLEVRASHILISVPEDASPEDTLRAYRAAVAMRGRLEEGADFGEMAVKFSNDPSVSKNRGDLGYFTAFQTVYPFESAAYTLSEGKISQPIRSKSGYHIIKVANRRTNRGLVRVAHIMIQLDSTASAVQRELAKEKNR